MTGHYRDMRMPTWGYVLRMFAAYLAFASLGGLIAFLAVALVARTTATLCFLVGIATAMVLRRAFLRVVCVETWQWLLQ